MKTHAAVDNGYGQDKGVVCNTDGDDIKLTNIDADITCKKCLKLLELPNE